jgi:hypothetical protein
MKALTFKTSIKSEKDALNIANLLQNYFTLKRADFELSERSSVLYVEGKNLIPKKIEQAIQLFGYRCRLLL